jgi:hypothetical protein
VAAGIGEGGEVAGGRATMQDTAAARMTNATPSGVIGRNGSRMMAEIAIIANALIRRSRGARANVVTGFRQAGAAVLVS